MATSMNRLGTANDELFNLYAKQYTNDSNINDWVSRMLITEIKTFDNFCRYGHIVNGNIGNMIAKLHENALYVARQDFNSVRAIMKLENGVLSFVERDIHHLYPSIERLVEREGLVTQIVTDDIVLPSSAKNLKQYLFKKMEDVDDSKLLKRTSINRQQTVREYPEVSFEGLDQEVVDFVTARSSDFNVRAFSNLTWHEITVEEAPF